MDDFSSLSLSRRRFSPLAALWSGILLLILCFGTGCGDYTLFGDEDGPCDPDPCVNRDNATAGTCTVVGESDYACDCDSGYFWKDDGNTCEDPCASDPCDGIENAVNGSCAGVDVDAYTCDCDAGFVWDAGAKACEEDPCDSGPCDGIENAVDGSCAASGGSDFTCQCEDSYYWKDDGNTCEDPCASDPCDEIENAVDGSCEGVDADDYTCGCDAGYTWGSGSHTCTADAVGTCDDLQDCLGDCEGINDTDCLSFCNWRWTGCECELDWIALLLACRPSCSSECVDVNSKACWDCALDCGFDTQCH